MKRLLQLFHSFNVKIFKLKILKYRLNSIKFHYEVAWRAFQGKNIQSLYFFGMTNTVSNRDSFTEAV